jgi:hypothetical protein
MIHLNLFKKNNLYIFLKIHLKINIQYLEIFFFLAFNFFKKNKFTKLISLLIIKIYFFSIFKK